MRTDWAVTYEIVTPESAEQGEANERGYAEHGCTLREAVAYMCGEGGLEASDSEAGLARWLTAYNTDEDYATGAETSHSLHIPERITASSRRRLYWLLRGH